MGGGTEKNRSVFTADYHEIGTLKWTPNLNLSGIIVATASGLPDEFDLEHIGPENLLAT
jgi:hypothetical protein